jgi:uncharacterized metal-binding protein
MMEEIASVTKNHTHRTVYIALAPIIHQNKANARLVCIQLADASSVLEVCHQLPVFKEEVMDMSHL